MKTLIGCLLLLSALWAAPAWGAVVFDATANARVAPGTTLSIPITLGSAANRAIVVCVSTQSDLLGFATNLGGTSLPEISGTRNTTSLADCFGAATTLTGAQTVTISWTTSQVVAAGVISASGVDQTTPITNGVLLNGVTPLSLSLTSAAGDLTVTNFSQGGAGNTVGSTNQTLRWGPLAVGSTGSGAGDTGPGTANPTHTWTAAGSAGIGISGVNFKQFVSGGLPSAPTLTSPIPARFPITPGATAGTSYTVKCGTVTGGPYPTTFNSASLIPAVQSVVTSPGTYFCVATATNASGESPNSNEVSFTIESHVR